MSACNLYTGSLLDYKSGRTSPFCFFFSFYLAFLSLAQCTLPSLIYNYMVFRFSNFYLVVTSLICIYCLDR
ncbi:hypothetical protein C8R43DRAFT_242892 [Mycena crocata]|nr:hypothetical protein C8R43DRAFT_242892 [Mycena crocata]